MDNLKLLSLNNKEENEQSPPPICSVRKNKLKRVTGLESPRFTNGCAVSFWPYKMFKSKAWSESLVRR